MVDELMNVRENLLRYHSLPRALTFIVCKHGIYKRLLSRGEKRPLLKTSDEIIESIS